MYMKASAPVAVKEYLSTDYSPGQTGVAWEAIQRSRNLAAYVPGDCPEPQLELIVILPQAE